MVVEAVKAGIFKRGMKLVPFILKTIPRFEKGDILAVTSKVVALSQGRVVPLKRKEAVIRKESARSLEGKWCYLTLKNGEWCANAGVDESNGAGKVVLLPEEPRLVARKLLKELKTAYHISRCGVIVTDTRTVPLRKGSLGVALAWAGFEGLESYVGRRDIFGRKLRMERANIADALAVAAVLTMGEGNERKPLAVLRETGVRFNNRAYAHRSLAIRPEDDIYRPLYKT